MLNYFQLNVGPLGTNCYIPYCDTTQEALVIDPGGDVKMILHLLQQKELTLVGIVNTHGHADHIAANGLLKDATQVPVMIHPQDADMLTSPNRNLSTWLGAEVSLYPADRLLSEGDVVRFGTCELAVLHTPGHTAGGICLVGGGVVFCGDTLFQESIGRTDFPGGSYGQLITSIQKKLLTLPDATIVLPGHGPQTSIGWERSHNPFIQG